jgi:hypothetical protein
MGDKSFGVSLRMHYSTDTDTSTPSLTVAHRNWKVELDFSVARKMNQ